MPARSSNPRAPRGNAILARQIAHAGSPPRRPILAAICQLTSSVASRVSVSNTFWIMALSMTMP